VAVLYSNRLIIGMVAMLGLVVGLLWAFLAVPLYTATAVIAFDPEKGGESLSLDDLTSSMPGGSDTKTKIETEVKILNSESIGMDVISHLNLSNNPLFFRNRLKSAVGSPRYQGELARNWSKALAVRSIPKTNLIEIKFQGPDPQLNAKIVNDVVSTYVERNFRVKYNSATQASEWLTRQLADIKSKTEASEQTLANYEKQSGIMIVNGDIGAEPPSDKKGSGNSIVLAQLADIDTAYTAARVARIQAEASYRIAQTGSAELITQIVQGSALPAMRAQQADVRNQYAIAAAKYGPSFPKVEQLKAQVAQIDASIKEEIARTLERLKSEYLAAKNTESDLNTQVETLKNEAFKLNDSAIQLQLLQRDAQGNRQLYDDLLKRLNEAGVVASLKSTNVTVVDSARVPDQPSSLSKRTRPMIGFVLGLCFGILGAFVKESLHDSIATIQNVESLVGGSLIGVIPDFSDLSKRKSRSSKEDISPVSPSDRPKVVITHPNSYIAEAFRTLRTAILLSRPNVPPKSIILSSGLPAEGKSTVSFNLALVLAQRDSRVLLVDADMRKGRLHLIASVPKTPGLSAVLSGVIPLADAIVPVPALTKLSFMPCGAQPPNPSELIDSSAMDHLLEEAAQIFDFIIIDTPPVLLVTDAVILSSKVDATILVARSRVTTKKALQRLLDVIRHTGGNCIGVVLNGVDVHAPGSYEGAYYKYGGYYGGYGASDADTK
jgi:capsular exopolysaccharide synthesis family protein